MHKHAHTFQLPPHSCLVDSSAEQAFGRFVSAFAGPRNVKHSGTHASSTPASDERPAVHRLTIVLESERPELSTMTSAAAQRAVNISATMPAQTFVERMEACIAAVASGGEVNLEPSPGVDLGTGGDRTVAFTRDTRTGEIIDMADVQAGDLETESQDPQ